MQATSHRYLSDRHALTSVGLLAPPGSGGSVLHRRVMYLCQLRPAQCHYDVPYGQDMWVLGLRRAGRDQGRHGVGTLDLNPLAEVSTKFYKRPTKAEPSLLTFVSYDLGPANTRSWKGMRFVGATVTCTLQICSLRVCGSAACCVRASQRGDCAAPRYVVRCGNAWPGVALANLCWT